MLIIFLGNNKTVNAFKKKIQLLIHKGQINKDLDNNCKAPL
jgi:hypothetical protein